MTHKQLTIKESSESSKSSITFNENSNFDDINDVVDEKNN